MNTLFNRLLKIGGPFYQKIVKLYKSFIESHIKNSFQKTTTYIDAHKSLAYSVLTFDLLVAFFALPLALYIKIGDEFFDYSREYLLKMSFCYTLCSLAFFNLFHTYQVMWRYLETSDIVRHFASVTLATLTFIPIKILLSHDEELPRLILLMMWVFLLLVTLTPRFFSYLQHNKNKFSHSKRSPLLILGTNDRTELFLKEIAQMDDFPHAAYALISLRPDEVGLTIHGVPVSTSINDLASWLKSLKSQKNTLYSPNDFRLVIIESPGKYLSDVLHIAKNEDIPLLRPTTTFSLDNGDLKELSLESLFKDPLIELTKSQEAHFKGKTILLTNAGLPIFKPLISNLLNLNIKKLILVDQSFERIEKIKNHIEANIAHTQPCDYYIAHINDHTFMEHLIGKLNPDMLIHTSSMSWSGEHNKLSYIRTNILSTEFIAYVAQKNKIKQCLFLFETSHNPDILFYESLIKAAFMRYALEKETQFLLLNAENVIGSSYARTTEIQQNIQNGTDIYLHSKGEKANFMTAQQLSMLLLQAFHDLKDNHDLLEYTLNTHRTVFVEDLAKHMLSLEKDAMKTEIAISSKESTSDYSLSSSMQKFVKTKNPCLLSKEYIAWIEGENLQYILQASDNCDEDFLERILKKHDLFLKEQHHEAQHKKKVA